MSRPSLNILLLLLAAACGEPALERPEPAARARPSALAWSRVTPELEPDGRTQPVAFELPDSPAVFGVRAYAEHAADSSALCFQLEDVIVASDQTWVPSATGADYDDYCESCAQRVAVGAGYGFFQLPSGPEPPSPLGRVEFRIALRDCLTLAPLAAATERPAELQVDYAAWRPPPRMQELRLALRVVNASQYALARDPELLARALARTREIWSEAGIQLAIDDPLTVQTESGPLVYSAEDRSALRSLASRARQALEAHGGEAEAPQLIVAPCLRRKDVLTGGQTEPLALSAHGLGGFAVHGETDALFVAGERCEGLSPEPEFDDSDTLAAIIAHELGHYLGLYHVAERDGREDRLVDTSPEQLNLMRSLPSAAATSLSESQVDIARRHVSFAASRVLETHPL